MINNSSACTDKKENTSTEALQLLTLSELKAIKAMLKKDTSFDPVLEARAPVRQQLDDDGSLKRRVDSLSRQMERVTTSVEQGRVRALLPYQFDPLFERVDDLAVEIQDMEMLISSCEDQLWKLQTRCLDETRCLTNKVKDMEAQLSKLQPSPPASSFSSGGESAKSPRDSPSFSNVPAMYSPESSPQTPIGWRRFQDDLLDCRSRGGSTVAPMAPATIKHEQASQTYTKSSRCAPRARRGRRAKVQSPHASQRIVRPGDNTVFKSNKKATGQTDHQASQSVKPASDDLDRPQVRGHYTSSNQFIW